MIGDPPPPPPHSIEAEQSVLGAILVNNEAMDRVSKYLEPEYFFEPLHQAIYDTALKLISSGKLASPITMKLLLPADTKIAEGMNLGQYLARLAAEATTIINAPDYAISIRELYDRRCVLQVAERMQDPAATEAVENAAAAIEELDTIVASRSGSAAVTVSMSQSVDRSIEASAAAFRSDGHITGLPLGLTELDNKLNGAQKTDLIIVGGRPSSGKTSLVTTFAKSMAGCGAAGIFFSAEMNDRQLTTRMISDEMFDRSEALHYADILKGNYGSKSFQSIRDAGDRLRDLNIRIDQTPTPMVAQIAARSRQMKRRKKLDFIIIDHLGFVRDSGRSNNLNERIGNITSGLKGLAKELEVPVFLLCQLSRKVEEREDKRPRMDDLRDSGNIEQDADVIMMVYREAYYLERKHLKVGSAEYGMNQDRLLEVYNQMDVIVEKNRMGPIGSCRLFCSIKHNAIRDFGHEQGRGSIGRYMPDESTPELAF